MYYKNLYIRDFGILKNQNLNNIKNGLVVIGGKNRAGKSTFFKLLRHLPYGLPQTDTIPPANNKYYIEAEIKKNNNNFNVVLDGYSNPKVTAENDQEYTGSELFNQLDQLTYQHLFSISLDELQHLSKIANNKKKEERLFSILLGAGFSELVKVPELVAKYFNYAKKIGGILGDPSVADFKPYYKGIKRAEKVRDQALLEIKEFNQKRKTLKEKEKNLKNLKEKLKNLENQFFLLDLLKNNYNKLKKIVKMKIKIEEIVLDLSNYQADNKSNFEKLGINTNQNKLNTFFDFIKNKNEKIKQYQKNNELIKEKIKNYQNQKDKIDNGFQVLNSELKALNNNWDQPFKKIENIEIDLIQEKKLNNKILQFEKIEQEIEKIRSEISNLQFFVEENKFELETIKFKEPTVILKWSYFILSFSFLTISISFFINLEQLRYLSLFLALAAYIYYSSNYKSSKLEQKKADKIKKENQKKNLRIEDLELQIQNKTKKLNKLKSNLEVYARMLGVSEKNHFSFLDSYFSKIKDKKRRFVNLKLEKKENENKKREIKKYLYDLKNLLENAAKYCKLDFNILDGLADSNLIENNKIIFGDFNLFNNLFNLTNDYLSQKLQIENTLKASDKTRAAFNFKNKENNHYQIFIHLFRQFSSLTAVEKEKKLVSKQITNLEKEKEEKEELITTLKNRINSLSTSTKIKKAQRKIDQNQNDLEKKARDYAVNRSVSYILKKLRSQMIEKAEKELLKPAAKILSELSNQHYTSLKTKFDFKKSDFRITTAGGNEYDSVNKLSRGSLEQLFLAVRISRIKEIKPPLPIVLDDSLVNFDRNHLYNTASLISDLANQYQIFILSCHPHLISYINRLSNSAQYWKLEKGNFELTNQQDLISYLNY